MQRTFNLRARAGAACAVLASVLGLAGCDQPGERASSSGAGSAAQSGAGASPTQSVNDTAITAAVKAGLLTEPSLKVLQISVDTDKGVVRLSGTVDTALSVQKAAQVAGGVKGVKAVDNRLVVNSKG